MLSIKNLCAEINTKKILKGINLEIRPGEIHAIMGPNGSGKSTLSKVISGHPDYEVTKGSIDYEIDFKHQNILEMAPEDRSRNGLFVAYQYPIEVPGVKNSEFLRAAFNAVSTHQGAEEMDPIEFDDFLKEKLNFLEMNQSVASRELNVDFSGGEKKRNEILQMAILSPRVSILDETDSGLDVDALKAVAKGVNKLHSSETSIILITHYQRLLNYITPDYVHILINGKIVQSGDKSLALEVEKNGYENFLKTMKVQE